MSIRIVGFVSLAFGALLSFLAISIASEVQMQELYSAGLRPLTDQLGLNIQTALVGGGLVLFLFGSSILSERQ